MTSSFARLALFATRQLSHVCDVVAALPHGHYRSAAMGNTSSQMVNGEVVEGSGLEVEDSQEQPELSQEMEVDEANPALSNDGEVDLHPLY